MTTPAETCQSVVAEFDATMDVRVVRSIALRYASGADRATDRPAHVRAGSGLVWIGANLAVIQDDANFIALVDPQTGVADCITMPAGHGGLRQFDDARGNKAFKNDFESIVVIPAHDGTRLLAFGSGSTSRREQIAIVDLTTTLAPQIRVVHVPEFYKLLRGNRNFAGSELNIEGAVIVNEHLRLFGRGNGTERDGVRAVNATCDINLPDLMAHLENTDTCAPPPPERVCQYELGEIGGTKLSFTDAATLTPEWISVTGFGAPTAGPSQRRSFDYAIVYSAAAEASPDTVQDGEVRGSAIGVALYSNGKTVLRCAHVRQADGTSVPLKVEGVAVGTEPGQLFVVVDSDDHARPSELFELRMQIGLPGANPSQAVIV